MIILPKDRSLSLSIEEINSEYSNTEKAMQNVEMGFTGSTKIIK